MRSPRAAIIMSTSATVAAAGFSIHTCKPAPNASNGELRMQLRGNAQEHRVQFLVRVHFGSGTVARVDPNCRLVRSASSLFTSATATSSAGEIQCGQYVRYACWPPRPHPRVPGVRNPADRSLVYPSHRRSEVVQVSLRHGNHVRVAAGSSGTARSRTLASAHRGMD